MVISLKRFLCVLLLIACAILFLISSFTAYANLTAFASKNEENVTVIIDPGHGGEDGGAVAEDGTVEKDLNLLIAMKLKALFIQNGFNVITTRETDIAIYDDGLDSLREKKASDMKNRLAIFNDNPNNIIISIHQNKFEQSKYHGTQIFYSNNNSQSALLAVEIKKSVISLLQPENKRETKAADKNIYLLYNCENPAVIVECGFISNPSELNLLKDDEYQGEIALSIFNGFMNHYSKQ